MKSLSRVRLPATPWTAAYQAPLSITNSQSLLKLIPSSQRCHPAISSSVVPFSFHHQSFPASGSFIMSQLFASDGQSIGVSGSASVLPVCVLVTQSCPPLCNPMDCSLPGSSVNGILQARILEWVAVPFSRGSSWPRNQTPRSPALQADSLPTELSGVHN